MNTSSAQLSLFVQARPPHHCRYSRVVGFRCKTRFSRKVLRVVHGSSLQLMGAHRDFAHKAFASSFGRIRAGSDPITKIWPFAVLIAHDSTRKSLRYRVISSVVDAKAFARPCFLAIAFLRATTCCKACCLVLVGRPASPPRRESSIFLEHWRPGTFLTVSSECFCGP